MAADLYSVVMGANWCLSTAMSINIIFLHMHATQQLDVKIRHGDEATSSCVCMFPTCICTQQLDVKIRHGDEATSSCVCMFPTEVGHSIFFW